MPVDSCKLLRVGEYVEDRLASRTTHVYSVRYSGAMTRRDILIGAENAPPPNPETPPSPLPGMSDVIDGLPVVRRSCTKLSSGVAVVHVLASNASYYTTTPFDGSPVSGGETSRQPFNIPFVSYNDDGSSVVRYWEDFRSSTTRVYQTLVGDEYQEEVQNAIDDWLEWVFNFGGNRPFLFYRGAIRRAQNQMIQVSLYFQQTARVPQFPAGTIGNDADVPSLGVLEEYYIDYPEEFVAVGPPSPPIVRVRSWQTRYRPYTNQFSPFFWQPLPGIPTSGFRPPQGTPSFLPPSP